MLGRRSLVRTNVKLDYCDVKACAGCPRLSKCTKGTYRTVTRNEGDAVLEPIAKRLRENPEILTERRNTVEHPFGTIKQSMNQSACLMRRLENVRGEFGLTANAYNIRRALNLVGVKGLIAAPTKFWRNRANPPAKTAFRLPETVQRWPLGLRPVRV
jgi:hypothetical protein